MKILFLDVDGVLNTKDSWDADHFHYERTGETFHGSIDYACVHRLHRILDETGAIVVLSSSWRGIPDLENRLQEAGVLAHAHADYRTPRHGWTGSDREYVNRGTEIQHWLDEHPGVTKFAIVDDDSDMLDHQMPFYVKTVFDDGSLTDEAADQLIEILNS